MGHKTYKNVVSTVEVICQTKKVCHVEYVNIGR